MLARVVNVYKLISAARVHLGAIFQNQPAQKFNFAPNWITRGSPADVIEPNPAAAFAARR